MLPKPTPLSLNWTAATTTLTFHSIQQIHVFCLRALTHSSCARSPMLATKHVTAWSTARSALATARSHSDCSPVIRHHSAQRSYSISPLYLSIVLTAPLVTVLTSALSRCRSLTRRSGQWSVRVSKWDPAHGATLHFHLLRSSGLIVYRVSGAPLQAISSLWVAVWFLTLWFSSRVSGSTDS